MNFQDCANPAGENAEFLALDSYSAISEGKPIGDPMRLLDAAHFPVYVRLKVRTVDEGEWNALRNRLRGEYLKLRDFVSSVDEWKSGDYIGGVMAILTHSAYHLGAIRQLVDV